MAAPHPSSSRNCLTTPRTHESVPALPLEMRTFYGGLKSFAVHNDSSLHTPRSSYVGIGHSEYQKRVGCGTSTTTPPLSIRSDRHHLQTMPTNILSDSLNRFMEDDEDDSGMNLRRTCRTSDAKMNDEHPKKNIESHPKGFGSLEGANGVGGKHSTVLGIDKANGGVQPRSATCGGPREYLRPASLFTAQTREDYVQQVRETAAAPQQCILCRQPLPSHVNLRDHLSMCPQNTASCPHCRKGFQIQALNSHMVECQQHIRSCFVCDAFVPAKTYLTHVSNCKEKGNSGSTHVSGGGGPNKAVECRKLVPVRMYHGTTEEAAQQILSSQMFHVSEKGLLGEGVYVSADIQKALRYGPAVLECAVYPGKTITIIKRFHPLQKNWRRHGYDSAWIPPNSFVSTSKRSDEASSSSSTIILFSEGGGEGLPSSSMCRAEADRELESSFSSGNDLDSHVANLAGTRNATGGELEENCVGDPRRVVPLRLVRGGGLGTK